ncbi:MAG: YkvA family protein [Saprospiraceae bacterium]
MKNPFEKYTEKFSENRLWKKLKNFATQAGVKTVYSALLLYYAYRRKETPLWAKNIILGTLGYFLAPIDAIPDLTPFLGYTDDVGVLSFGLVTIAGFVNKDVRKQARTQLAKWFDKYEENILEEVDQQL